MAAERERRDDAEVAAAPAQGPEEIRLSLGVGLHDRAVGQDDCRRDEIVDREPQCPRQMSNASAEGEPTDARGADDSDGNAQPVLMRGVEHVLEQRPASDPRQLRRRVDLDRVHLREIDHQPAVDAAQAAAVVAAAAHGDPEAVLDAVAQRRGDVRLVGAVRDRGRTLVDHRVVERA